MPSLPCRRAARSRRFARLIGLFLATLSAACVYEDAKTGKPIPRGDQKFPFDAVERRAERLKTGMSKYEVQLLLGSPAERDETGNLWVYLPERYGILVPARALRLEFRDELLAEHGYRAIVLGTRL